MSSKLVQSPHDKNEARREHNFPSGLNLFLGLKDEQAMKQYQPNPPDASEIPFGFTEADGVHEKTWEEKYHADAETLKTRGFTSDFCGAWIAFWSHIAKGYGPALEAESARMRARKGLPGESCEQILQKASGVAMALMGALIRSDSKTKSQRRRDKIPAWQLECARRGHAVDFADMNKEEKTRRQHNLARAWREVWPYLHVLQRVTRLPLFLKDCRSFKDNTRAAEAASYTDYLTDIFGEIIRLKNAARGGRVARFEKATVDALAKFRRETEHECQDRKQCQRPHVFASEAGKEHKGNPGSGVADILNELGVEPDDELPGGARPRARVISFAKAKEKILAGVEIACARANAGRLTPDEAEQLVSMLAPVVEIAMHARASAKESGVPVEDFATEATEARPSPDAEFVPPTQNEKCDFPAKNEESHMAPEEINLRLDDPSEVTLDDFLSAFFPDPCEETNLRAFGPKGAPDEARFSPRKWRTCREALACDAALLAELHEANRTCGIYFVVNSGGDKAKDITRINGFFAEMDDGALASQHAKYDASPLMPAVRIETLKSVHGHWPAAPGVTLDEFGEIQRRLIHHFKSDPKIKDRSRVMRVPGFNHVAYNAGLLSYKPVTLAAFDTSRRYTAAEMLAAFPAVPATKPKPQREPKTLEQLSGDLEAFKRELGLRIMSHPTARRNGRGNWDCRAVCHNGKGASGLFYDPSGNFVWCNAESSCALETIGIAFGVKRARGAA
jgi:hypothetical protein